MSSVMDGINRALAAIGEHEKAHGQPKYVIGVDPGVPDSVRAYMQFMVEKPEVEAAIDRGMRAAFMGQPLGDLHNEMTRVLTGFRMPVTPWVLGNNPNGATGGNRWACECGLAAAYWKDVAGCACPVACEACAERAGVFGPVAPLIIIDEATEFTDKQWEFLTDMPRPAGERAVQWTADAKPTCSGPLDTHGAPVLRWRGSLLGGSSLMQMCDRCYLYAENLMASDAALDARDAANAKPPIAPTARVGTVPQSLGPMRGIWASRGMRGR